jgi:hypothetical protein
VIRTSYFTGIDFVPANLELQEFEHETPKILADIDRIIKAEINDYPAFAFDPAALPVTRLFLVGKRRTTLLPSQSGRKFAEIRLEIVDSHAVSLARPTRQKRKSRRKGMSSPTPVKRRLLTLLGGSIAAPLLAPRTAFSQEEWPTRPVRYVNGFPAGGATHTLSRISARRWANFPDSRSSSRTE